jgi:hypothetical protein
MTLAALRMIGQVFVLGGACIATPARADVAGAADPQLQAYVAQHLEAVYQMQEAPVRVAPRRAAQLRLVRLRLDTRLRSAERRS